MLDTNASRWSQFGTEMIDLISSLASIEEGACVIRASENGVGKGNLSAGANTDFYAGVAVNSGKNFSQISAFEDITIPSTGPYTATLGATPIAPVTATYNPVGTAITVGTSAPSGTNVIQQVGKNITFHSADAGKKVRIFYKKNLTVVEAQALFGEFAGAGNGLPGKSGIITKGEAVYTTFWDPASDWWTKVGPVYTGANGNFTLATGGVVCAGVTVLRAPSADFPFLGLNLL